MTPTGFSRRRWLAASAACGCALASTVGFGQAQEEAPEGYTKAKPVTDFSRAPGMRSRLIGSLPSGPRTYVIAFADGDEVFSGLTGFAKQNGLKAAQVQAIGAFQSALFGWYDLSRQLYRNIQVEEQAEVVSLLGNVTIAEGNTFAHLHGSVAMQDGTVRGGHMLHAIVRPTLEMFITEQPEPLTKRRNVAFGLDILDLGGG